MFNLQKPDKNQENMKAKKASANSRKTRPISAASALKRQVADLENALSKKSLEMNILKNALSATGEKNQSRP